MPFSRSTSGVCLIVPVSSPCFVNLANSQVFPKYLPLPLPLILPLPLWRLLASLHPSKSSNLEIVVPCSLVPSNTEHPSAWSKSLCSRPPLSSRPLLDSATSRFISLPSALLLNKVSLASFVFKSVFTTASSASIASLIDKLSMQSEAEETRILSALSGVHSSLMSYLVPSTISSDFNTSEIASLIPRFVSEKCCLSAFPSEEKPPTITEMLP
uniref:Uncharacterized protein n=1 Tax=Opuntia streptacantha TaxID=393608 RepID=A0A7C8ZUK4_OPUST